jgi:hypothetical protein
MPGLSYYWSASQSEYATDVLFGHAQELQKLYPHFLRHAISSFQSPDVLRFLGRKVPQNSGRPHAGFGGEISSRLQQRTEGVRIRHSLNGNSLKMYDKEGSVLRVETTIVRPAEFRVYRPKEGQPKAKKSRDPPPQRRHYSPICPAASSWLIAQIASHPSLPSHRQRPSNYHRSTSRL